MEQHRILVTQHINVSTHWATALRQLILTLCPDMESMADQNTPAQLTETDVVQFVDISTKPVVLDSNVPAFLQQSNQPLPMLSGDPTEQPANDSNAADSANSNSSANTDSGEPNANTTKSKFGRFGRILHI